MKEFMIKCFVITFCAWIIVHKIGDILPKYSFPEHDKRNNSITGDCEYRTFLGWQRLG